VALAIAGVFLAASSAWAACDHPYFPMRPGARHVYRASGIEVTEAVTGIAGDVVTLSVTTGAGPQLRTTTVTQTCTAEGIGSQTVNSADGKTKVRTLKRTGPEYGPAAQMKVGGTWAFQDVTESVHGKMTVTRDRRSTSRVTGSERVHVAAGDFEALRVESVVDATTTVIGADPRRAPATGPRHSTSVAWLARGVGLVKMVTASEGGEESPAVELISFTR